MRHRRAPGSYGAPELPMTTSDLTDPTSSRKGRRKKRKRNERSGLMILGGCCFCLISLSCCVLLVSIHHSDETSGGTLKEKLKHKMNQKINRKMNKQKERREEKVYEAITCSDGSLGYLNDDYCDCMDDGRDEPKTSACSNLRIKQEALLCESRLEIGPDGSPQMIRVYPSRINDGIQDCLDGSDEKPK